MTRIMNIITDSAMLFSTKTGNSNWLCVSVEMKKAGMPEGPDDAQDQGGGERPRPVSPWSFQKAISRGFHNVSAAWWNSSDSFKLFQASRGMKSPPLNVQK
jgi:hypothetical protein